MSTDAGAGGGCCCCDGGGVDGGDVYGSSLGD